MKLELSFSKEKKKNGYNWNQFVRDLLIQKRDGDYTFLV
jgi:hypothetical protein